MARIVSIPRLEDFENREVMAYARQCYENQQRQCQAEVDLYVSLLKDAHRAGDERAMTRAQVGMAVALAGRQRCVDWLTSMAPKGGGFLEGIVRGEEVGIGPEGKCRREP